MFSSFRWKRTWGKSSSATATLPTTRYTRTWPRTYLPRRTRTRTASFPPESSRTNTTSCDVAGVHCKDSRVRWNVLFKWRVPEQFVKLGGWSFLTWNPFYIKKRRSFRIISSIFYEFYVQKILKKPFAQHIEGFNHLWKCLEIKKIGLTNNNTKKYMFTFELKWSVLFDDALK